MLRRCAASASLFQMMPRPARVRGSVAYALDSGDARSGNMQRVPTLCARAASPKIATSFTAPRLRVRAYGCPRAETSAAVQNVRR